MATMRVHKTADYTVMSNRHFRERKMSLKAKGLLSLMLSLPEDWDYSVAGLATLSKDGKDSVNAALQELERFGYLVRTRTSDAGGKFTGYDYDIYEEPVAVFSSAPYPENPHTDKPYPENPPQSITDLPSTNGQSTDDKRDKQDKPDKEKGEAGLPRRGLSSSERMERAMRKTEERAELEKRAYLTPSALTKMLVKAGYIAKDDAYIADYNDFLAGLSDDFGFETVRTCVDYFLSRVKGNRDSIVNRRAYFKAAMAAGISAYTQDWSEIAKRLGVGADA